MSFSGVGGTLSLSVGSSTRCWVSWGTPDMGAQWIQPNPVGPGTVQANDFGKARTINADGQSFSVTYWCTVTALDDGGSGYGEVLFNLEGGGNV